MINMDSWVRSYLIARDDILGYVKFELLWKHLPRMFFSRTKVRGSKTIIYRRGLNHRQCRLEIGVVSFLTPSAPHEKSKLRRSEGGMVARLKLKGIDGRPQRGVELAA